MTRAELRTLIRAIIAEEETPLCPPYWDDGAAPLSDSAVDRIIEAVQQLVEG